MFPPGNGLVGFDTIGPIGLDGRVMPPVELPFSGEDLSGELTRPDIDPLRLMEPVPRLIVEPMLRVEKLPPERLAPPFPPFPPAYALVAKAAALIAATPIVNLLKRFIVLVSLA
jgi:hypothetical protein